MAEWQKPPVAKLVEMIQVFYPPLARKGFCV